MNLTEIFGITDPSQVNEKYRPYLYHSNRGDWLLNVSLKNLQQEGKYGHTHSLEASVKGVKGSIKLMELKEYIKKQQQDARQTPRQEAQGARDNSNVVNF